MSSSPYASQPERAFWRPAIADRHFSEIEAVWDPIRLSPEDAVATAGSCFAQHIGRQLKRRGANYLDLEEAPYVLSEDEDKQRFGFGLFSCRYGNIYTARQLRQLFEEAFEQRVPAERVWTRDGRFFDALRPGVDPVGQDSEETVIELRNRHLAAVRKMFTQLDLFVFTLGLTECWESTVDGTAYPTAPGTICGQFDAQKYALRNLRHAEIMEDMESFWTALKRINPGARMLLTVSPVPLTATATDDHVLVATTYSKSVLRAVAGDLATDHEEIGYFPSYEIVSSHVARGAAFNPDLRTVNQAGVNGVMQHFFSGALGEAFSGRRATQTNGPDDEVICDEERLEAFLKK